MTRAGRVDGANKLVLVGPAAAGKTTFKRVFFEQANPLKLLDQGLNPTRGIENTIFSRFSETIGVWDLAGQELAAWLGDGRGVFHHSSVVVFMMSAIDPLKKNVSFLVEAMKVLSDVAPNARPFLLLHKCDRVSLIDARMATRHMADFVRVKHPEFAAACTPASFQLTSVTEPHFPRSLSVAYTIIKSCLLSQETNVPATELRSAERRVRLLSSHEPGVWFSMTDVSSRYSLSLTETDEHLEALREAGYVEKRRDSFFRITEKGAFIARAFKQDPDNAQASLVAGDLALFMRRPIGT